MDLLITGPSFGRDFVTRVRGVLMGGQRGPFRESGSNQSREKDKVVSSTPVL